MRESTQNFRSLLYTCGLGREVAMSFNLMSLSKTPSSPLHCCKKVTAITTGSLATTHTNHPTSQPPKAPLQYPLSGSPKHHQCPCKTTSTYLRPPTHIARVNSPPTYNKHHPLIPTIHQHPTPITHLPFKHLV